MDALLNRLQTVQNVGVYLTNSSSRTNYWHLHFYWDLEGFTLLTGKISEVNIQWKIFQYFSNISVKLGWCHYEPIPTWQYNITVLLPWNFFLFKFKLFSKSVIPKYISTNEWIVWCSFKVLLTLSSNF